MYKKISVDPTTFSEITRDAIACADQKTSIKPKNGIEDANLNELTIIVAFADPGMVVLELIVTIDTY